MYCRGHENWSCSWSRPEVRGGRCKEVVLWNFFLSYSAHTSLSSLPIFPSRLPWPNQGYDSCGNRHNQQAASLQSSCRFCLLVCQYIEGICKLQVEQLAESQRQEWTAAAAEYERKVIKVSGELRSAMDAADRSASYSCNFSARNQSKVLSASHPLRV